MVKFRGNVPSADDYYHPNYFEHPWGLGECGIVEVANVENTN